MLYIANELFQIFKLLIFKTGGLLKSRGYLGGYLSKLGTIKVFVSFFDCGYGMLGQWHQ